MGELLKMEGRLSVDDKHPAWWWGRKLVASLIETGSFQQPENFETAPTSSFCRPRIIFHY